MTNQWYSPAKVYGQLYKEDKGNGIPEPITASDSKPSSKVSITESGEAVLVPDIARISISYKSVKVCMPRMMDVKKCFSFDRSYNLIARNFCCYPSS